MKNYIFPLFTLFIFGTNLFSQNVAPFDAMFLPQGYVLKSLGGFGYSNCTIVTIPNICSSNPASLIDFDNLTAGLSYQFDTNIKPAWWFAQSHRRIMNGFPQSVGFVIPFKNLHIGIGTSQRYNSRLDFGEIPLTTAEEPEGTGETFNPIFNTYVMNYSALFSFSFKNLFYKYSILSFGFQYNLNRFYHEEIMGILHSKVSAYKSNWSAGIRYKLEENSTFGFQIGMFYESNLKVRGSTHMQLPSFVSGKRDVLLTYKGEIPNKMHFGFLIDPLFPLKFTCNLTYWNWSQVKNEDHAEGYFKDSFDLALNFIFLVNKKLTFPFGIFGTSRKYKESGYLYSEDSLNGLYLISGLLYRLNRFTVELVLADSHLFSGSYRKQTIGKLGLGFIVSQRLCRCEK